MGAPVVHFEIRGEDAASLRGFYEELFGWEIHADNPMNYGMVHTQADGKGIEGGVAEGDPRVHVVIEVPDLQAALDRAVELGGEVATPVTEIPGVVTFAELRDPAGNVTGIVKAGS